MHVSEAELSGDDAISSERTPCLICGGTNFRSRFPSIAEPVDQEASSEPYRITHSERKFVGAIVRCVDCGMVILPLDFVPSGSYTDAADPYYLEQEAERLANAHALLEHVPPGGKLLEIGCAAGFLLRAARDRGFDALGVEMSEWASGVARDQYGLDVRTGKLEDIGLADDTFDVVVLADVIEHLTDPRRTLREIGRVLKPGGRLLLLTPDAGSVVARIAGARWWGLLDDHYFYFSRDNLKRFLEGEGFEVVTITAHGRKFPLAHWLSKVDQYSPSVHRAIAGVVGALGIGELQVPVNLGDMMACVALKK